VQMLLAQTLGSNDEAGAMRALKAAVALDPSQASPHYALADLAEKTHDFPAELEALRALALLEQHEPKVYQRLLGRLNETGAYEEAVRIGEAALYADMSGLATHRLYAEALLGAGQRERAAFELESATLCEGTPEDLSEVHARFAEFLLASGKRAQAKREAAKARELDPKNARLSKLPH